MLCDGIYRRSFVGEKYSGDFGQTNEDLADWGRVSNFYGEADSWRVFRPSEKYLGDRSDFIQAFAWKREAIKQKKHLIGEAANFK